MKAEFFELVQDVRQFVMNRIEKKHRRIPFQTFRSEKRGSSLDRINTPQPEPEAYKTQEQSLKTHLASTQKIERTVADQSVPGWDLHSTIPPQGDISLTWKKKLEMHVKTCEPDLSVLLILPEEIPSHRFFLENISRAITRSFASASVVLFSNHLFSYNGIKLILAPLDLLQRKFPKINKTHHLFEEKLCHFIALENLDFYNNNVENKRALWSAIQLSSPLLSI